MPVGTVAEAFRNTVAEHGDRVAVRTLIYTSGTTGPPKGVQISHRNQMAAAAMY